jgi:hypothetical protein
MPSEYKENGGPLTVRRFFRYRIIAEGCPPVMNG